MVERLCAQLNEVTISCDMDLVGAIWHDRPALPASKTFELAQRYTGKSAAQKLSEVREAMAEAGADIHIITRVDDIAWLLNMRADDIPCFPVALCYILIDQQDAQCFISMTRDSAMISKTTFAQIGVRTAASDAIYWKKR